MMKKLYEIGIWPESGRKSSPLMATHIHCEAQDKEILNITKDSLISTFEILTNERMSASIKEVKVDLFESITDWDY